MWRALVVAAGAAVCCGCLEAPPGAPVFDAGPPDAGGGDAGASRTCGAVVAAATLTTCALIDGGTVRCLGFDANGELGNGEPLVDVDLASEVSDLDGVTALIGGSYGFCALRDDRMASCWGANDTAQNGDETTDLRASPAEVVGLAGIVDIERGGGHGCAIVDDGAIWCWGQNNNGQLGNGTSTATMTTRLRADVPPAIDVEASYGATCAVLAEDAGVACWGQVSGGFNTTTEMIYPLTDVVGLSMHSHSVYAVLGDGAVMAWGNNAFGQLGDDTIDHRVDAEIVQELPPATAVAAGGDHVCALVDGGEVWCWGRNEFGQTGTPNAPDAHLPRQVPDIPPAVAIASGQEHSCATTADGEVHCWGNGCCGQLGPRPNDTTSPPALVEQLCP